MKKLIRFGSTLLCLAVLSGLAYAADEQITVSYWGYVPFGSALPSILASTTAKYPNIKVDAQIMDWGPYWDKMSISFATGEGPDAFVLHPAYFEKFKAYMQPLDELAAQVLGAGWKQKFNEAILKEAYQGGSSLSAFPVGYGGQWFIFYNKSLLKQYGFPVPKSYADLLTIANGIKQKSLDILPIAFGAKEADNALYFYYGLVQDVSPGIVAKAAAGEVSWTDPAFVKGFQNFKKMIEDGVMPKAAFGMMPYPDANEMFQARKAFMTISGFWQANAYMTVEGSQLKGKPAEKDEIGVAVLPNMDGGTPWVLASIDHYYAINKDSKHQKEAMQVISEWTLGKAAQQWLSLLLAEPAAKDISLQPHFLSAEAKATFPVFHQSYSHVAGQRGSGNTGLDLKFGEIVQGVMVGSTSIQDGLAQVQTYYDQNK